MAFDVPCIFLCGRCKIIPGGMTMKEEEKQDEKKPIPWEVTDPKPPVVQSGHMVERRVH